MLQKLQPSPQHPEPGAQRSFQNHFCSDLSTVYMAAVAVAVKCRGSVKIER
ncbi:hypothetical protein Mapa_011641 [Marchantia paleacea]|nr:hypothetical protein Mapa_011641 [Marchantia paleacea]